MISESLKVSALPIALRLLVITDYTIQVYPRAGDLTEAGGRAQEATFLPPPKVS